MSSKKDHELMENLDKCFNLVQQNSTKGISAIELAKKLDKHRTTIHGYLSHLELIGKVERQRGLWFPKTSEHTIKPLEKEIVIELPMPKDKWFHVGRLQAHADYMDKIGLSGIGDTERILVENFNQTRRIKITGKNVSDLDIEKVSNLILEANEKSAKVSFKRILKSLKIPQLANEKNSAKQHSAQPEEKNGLNAH
jgi:hypothetical protein